jgi:formylglycine-generating enzyme required for sulfatase activity
MRPRSLFRCVWAVLLLPFGLVPPLLLAQPPASKPPPLDCTKGLTAKEVKEAQEAWAKYLRRKVEETVKLPMGVTMTFVLVPPGKFVMGSPKEEQDWVIKTLFDGKRLAQSNFLDFETQHEVTLTELFDLAKTEVTQAQYVALTTKQVKQATDEASLLASLRDRQTNPSEFSADGDGKGKVLDIPNKKLAEFPVERVSWVEAEAYAKKLTKTMDDKYVYRLPTEAEWEYACRGGLPSSKPFGGEDGTALKTGDANFGNHLKHTWKVESYQPNALGLFDMHGNVSEWCADWFGRYPTGAVTNPTGPEKGDHRVHRGGSWLAEAQFCRAASRDHRSPKFLGDDVGFRLARTVPVPTAGK